MLRSGFASVSSLSISSGASAAHSVPQLSAVATHSSSVLDSEGVPPVTDTSQFLGHVSLLWFSRRTLVCLWPNAGLLDPALLTSLPAGAVLHHTVLKLKGAGGTR